MWKRGVLTLAFRFRQTPHSVLIYYTVWDMPGHMTQAARQPKPATKPSLGS